jgi:hypothetical protein
MENPDDDPRAFAHDADGHAANIDSDGIPQDLAPLFRTYLLNSDVLGDLSL